MLTQLPDVLLLSAKLKSSSQGRGSRGDIGSIIGVSRSLQIFQKLNVQELSPKLDYEALRKANPFRVQANSDIQGGIFQQPYRPQGSHIWEARKAVGMLLPKAQICFSGLLY